MIKILKHNLIISVSYKRTLNPLFADKLCHNLIVYDLFARYNNK